MSNEMAFNVCLAEFKFVQDQMHRRMAIISTLVSISATFFVASVGFLSSVARETDPEILSPVILVLSIIFLFLGLLIFREDRLNLSHDAYFKNNLRPMILKKAEIPSSERELYLRFLDTMEAGKVKGLSDLLSAARYGFCFLGMFVCLSVFIARFHEALDIAQKVYIGIILVFILTLAICLQSLGGRSKRLFAGD